MPGRPRTGEFAEMHNRAMGRKLTTRRAIDLSMNPRIGGYYILDKFVERMDYCDAVREVWIWSIGKRKSDGVILASLTTDLYQNPDYECLWLR